jgi:hypothetical protein
LPRASPRCARGCSDEIWARFQAARLEVDAFFRDELAYDLSPNALIAYQRYPTKGNEQVVIIAENSLRHLAERQRALGRVLSLDERLDTVTTSAKEMIQPTCPKWYVP